MSRHTSASLALTLVLAALPAQAATNLSLTAALDLAKAHNPGILAQQHRWEAVQAQKKATQASILPSVSLQSGAGVSTKTTNALDSSLSVSQLLYDFNALGKEVDLADNQVKIAQYSLAQIEQDTLKNTAIAYFQVLRTESLAEVAQDTVKQAQEHLKIGALRLKTGTGTKAEVLQLQARLAATKVALIQAQNAVVLARLSLANLVNAPIQNQPLVAKTTIKYLPIALESELTAALARRPEIQNQSLKLTSDSLKESLEQTSTLPSLNAVGKYSQQNLAAGDLYAGINFNWPLFDGLKANHRVEAAKADTRADQAVLDQLKLAAELELREQYQTREEARLRVDASKEGRNAASEAYHLALHRYTLGLGTQTELADVQNTLLQARESTVQAEKDLAIAEIRLRRALGMDLARL